MGGGGEGEGEGSMRSSILFDNDDKVSLTLVNDKDSAKASTVEQYLCRFCL